MTPSGRAAPGPVVTSFISSRSRYTSQNLIKWGHDKLAVFFCSLDQTWHLEGISQQDYISQGCTNLECYQQMWQSLYGIWWAVWNRFSHVAVAGEKGFPWNSGTIFESYIPWQLTPFCPMIFGCKRFGKRGASLSDPAMPERTVWHESQKHFKAWLTLPNFKVHQHSSPQSIHPHLIERPIAVRHEKQDTPGHCWEFLANVFGRLLVCSFTKGVVFSVWVSLIFQTTAKSLGKNGLKPDTSQTQHLSTPGFRTCLWAGPAPVGNKGLAVSKVGGCAEYVRLEVFSSIKS